MNRVAATAATAFVAFTMCPVTLLTQARSDDGGNSAIPRRKDAPPNSRADAPPKSVGGESSPRRQEPAFSRREDRGEDFTKLSTEELVRRLAAAKDIGEQRKGAKVLGDRAITQSLNLQDAERQILEKYIASQLLRTTSNKGDERQEAIAQLQRLWRLSAPQLLDSLGHANLTVQEAAIKNLCLMRDESIVKELIGRVEGSKDANFRQGAVFALGMMRERRNPMVPDRNVLDDAASRDLAERLIIPFLNRIEATDTDPTMKRIVVHAKEFLDKPFDARPQPVPRQIDKKASSARNSSSGSFHDVPVTDHDAIATIRQEDAPSRPAEISEVPPSPSRYVISVGLGSVIVLAGFVWFGYRQSRKGK